MMNPPDPPDPPDPLTVLRAATLTHEGPVVESIVLSTRNGYYNLTVQMHVAYENLDEAMAIFNEYLDTTHVDGEPPCCDATWVDATDQAAVVMDLLGM